MRNTPFLALCNCSKLLPIRVCRIENMTLIVVSLTATTDEYNGVIKSYQIYILDLIRIIFSRTLYCQYGSTDIKSQVNKTWICTCSRNLCSQ